MVACFCIPLDIYKYLVMIIAGNKNTGVLILIIIILFTGFLGSAQKLVLMNYNDGNRVVNDDVINVDTSDLMAFELSAHLKIQNNTDKALAIFMKKIINQAVDSTSNYFCLNPKCWPDADSTDIADSIPAGLADSSFVTHYDHFFRYERPIPPGFTSITYLFYDHTTLPESVEARVTVNYHISGVGINAVETDGLSIFPVPAVNQVKITYGNYLAYPVSRITILDMQGRIARELAFIPRQNELFLDISDFDNGIYLAVLHTLGGKMITGKIVVNH